MQHAPVVYTRAHISSHAVQTPYIIYCTWHVGSSMSPPNGLTTSNHAKRQTKHAIARGAAKTKPTDPPPYICYIPDPPTHQPTFSGHFSARGVEKHHKHIFAKRPCRKLFPKQSTKFSMSVFPRFPLFLSRFQVFLGNESSKTLPKQNFAKQSCRKVFTKKSTKIVNRCFFRFVLSRFWAFLCEGRSKTPHTKH